MRCVGHCQLGDDRTPLGASLDGSPGGEVAFSHLDLDGLEAQVEIKRGVARVTRWASSIGSAPDLVSASSRSTGASVAASHASASAALPCS